MIIIECEQYSPEWWAIRIGVPTVSQFIKIQTATKGASVQRQKYLRQLAVEKVTGVYAGKDYQSFAMQRGHEKEDEARLMFQLVTGRKVRQVGFVFPDEQRKYGASPDGLMDDAGLEIFCPESDNAVECLFNQDKAIMVASKFQQVQGSMLVTGFKKWFYMMYYPGLHPLIQEIRRDDAFISKLKTELDKFCYELVTTVKKLKEMA